jgi:bud emergence protein 1
MSPIPPGMLSPIPKSAKTQAFYAVVLHDFVAERADELDAKRGDNISVVAQSNREWFVAKPIGKLGRPGLIPVAFVEVRDPATNQPVLDVEDMMNRGELPKVEEWKKAVMEYKNSSIPLGLFSDDSSAREMGVPNSPYMPPTPQMLQKPPFLKSSNSSSVPSIKSISSNCLPEGLLISADVVSFHYEADEYWFRIDATYQPYPRMGETALRSAFHLVLFRVYNDFYDFQVTLLNSFPLEAGRQTGHERILPYMPGPVDNVTQDITATRRTELDEYAHKLCELSKIGARYVLEHQIVREFLSQKPGDVRSSIDPRIEEMEAIFGYDYMKKTLVASRSASVDDVQEQLGHAKLSDEHHSDGSNYEDEGYASPQRPQYDRHPFAQPAQATRRPSTDSQALRHYAHAHNHQRTNSNSSLPSPSPFGSTSRSDSPENSSSFPWPPESHGASGQKPVSSRSRSHSNAASSYNSPPISAANPQTAFVKIKIFDRLSDDLIAIRVHPRVSLAELMDKVQGRLGPEVANLRFRDSLKRGFVGIDGDDTLRRWIETTDKHVLYAD